MKSTINLLGGANTNFDQAEREALQAGRWRVDCVSIELRQRSVHEPQVYSGPGYLFQNEDYQLSAKIYVTQMVGNSDRFSLFSSATEAGDLYPETEYYDIVAQDNRGRLWKSERLGLDSIDHGMGEHPILETSFDEIWCEAELRVWLDPNSAAQPSKAESSSFHFTVFESLDFPTNSSVEVQETVAGEAAGFRSSGCWIFEAAGCDWKILNRETFTVIVIDSPFKKLPDDFGEWALNALFFTLGKPIEPLIEQRTRGRLHRLTLRSRPRTFPRAKHQPPLHLNHQADFEWQGAEITPYRDMIDAYLRFTMIHLNPRFLWGQLNAVYESSTNQFIDSWVLTLSVVIESFVNNEFPELGAAPAQTIALVDEALALIQEHPTWPPKFKNRLNGSVGGIKSTRINDRLHILVRENAIDISAPDHWRDVRNMTAHGYQSSRGKEEKMRDGLAHLEVMFYHIFFRAIGYIGPFTDYSSRGWPTRDYPPK